MCGQSIKVEISPRKCYLPKDNPVILEHVDSTTKEEKSKSIHIYSVRCIPIYKCAARAQLRVNPHAHSNTFASDKSSQRINAAQPRPHPYT